MTQVMMKIHSNTEKKTPIQCDYDEERNTCLIFCIIPFQKNLFDWNNHKII